jgi:hypothetical protein
MQFRGVDVVHKTGKAGWEDENKVEEVYKNRSNLFQTNGRDSVFRIIAYKYRDRYPDT